jgi:L-cysteate sulfo-lyase
MNFARFPRTRLAHLPTPLEPLERLSAELGGPNIWIKRDDATGLALGGNKVRKLEFLIGKALVEGADTLVTMGAVQSNHVRQTAAAAARLGLACDVVLERRVKRTDDDYTKNGNRLLDDLFGARVFEVESVGDPQAELAARAKDVRARGGKPYIIPTGGSNGTGGLGYALAALELVHQAAEIGFSIDRVVLATGSCGTHAGLLAGLSGVTSRAKVDGVAVTDKKSALDDTVHELANEVAERIGVHGAISRDLVSIDHRFVGAGYGAPTPEMLAAVRLVAQREGIALDPVYSGKAMAALIARVREGAYPETENVVFLHTGGTPGLFAYRGAFES